MTRVVVVFHSRGGRTRALAEAVVRGASSIDGAKVTLASVEDPPWAELAGADAIVFGSPTFMGSVSSPFKAFMDASFDVWIVQGWRDKIAAGFTTSSAPSGDKLATLTQLAIFAAQHGMLWIGLGLHPSYAGGKSTGADVNRLGSHLGAMAQCDLGATAPPKGDLETGFLLGRRVALAAARWTRGDTREDASQRHPTARTWSFPPASRAELPNGVRRANLRELAARPDRLEHHLLVVARVGRTQIELVAASEPLAFAHLNRSDEHALALPTGDALIDGFPLRTFLSDVESGRDVGRINHRIGDLVLHPHGLLHWPGRMRPPYEPYPFGPGMRRTGLSLVFCACEETPPHDAPRAITEGRENDVKAYGTPPPPFALCETARHPPGVVAAVSDVTVTLVERPRTLAAPRGAYVIVLEASDPFFATDLVHVPRGVTLAGDGIERALVVASETSDAADPPESWRSLPALPFAPFEEGEAGTLPLVVGDLRFEERSASTVTATLGAPRDARGGATAEVPRHWLARMLYRVALHGYQLGYVETYGGLSCDDRNGLRIGLRGGGSVQVAPEDVERIYRAVAPPGYRERLD